MEKINNGKQRPPQQEGSNQIGHIKSEPRSMGVIPTFGGELRDYEIATGRKHSDEPDVAFGGEWTDSRISGKIISQLVDENEKQLAYHEEQRYYHQKQVEKVRDRIESLKRIPESLADIVHIVHTE
ncbi:hypothetical protein [Nostoc sp. WHI]|uniref:hypothetical protein n=1 Tax=Nostoc sp. WHI TaxID=2650611 RepID=UPI0018C705DC|nr:hypothetical protein [Nostoc sp. WHI]MBG1267761.1 hypothetical protein [Nostoc sp. WHI]